MLADKDLEVPVRERNSQQNGAGESSEWLVSWLRTGQLAAPSTSAPAFWEHLADAAIGHGLAPLLSRSKPSGAPESFLNRLRQAEVYTLSANLRQLGALEELQKDFTHEGIPHAVLKGAALLQAGIYSPGERPMSDIDVLVPREDLESARLVILRQGWSEESAAARSFALRHHHHWTYTKSGTPGLKLELHWAPSNAEVRIPPWGLLMRGDALAGAGGLPWATQLFFVAGNAAQHGFTDRLLLLYDLTRILSSEAGSDLDWDQVACLCRHSRTERAAGLALACAQNLFGLAGAVPVPESLLPHGFLDRWLFSRISKLHGCRSTTSKRLLRIAVADTWVERARIVCLAIVRRLARRGE